MQVRCVLVRKQHQSRRPNEQPRGLGNAKESEPTSGLERAEQANAGDVGLFVSHQRDISHEPRGRFVTQWRQCDSTAGALGTLDISFLGLESSMALVRRGFLASCRLARRSQPLFDTQQPMTDDVTNPRVPSPEFVDAATITRAAADASAGKCFTFSQAPTRVNRFPR